MRLLLVLAYPLLVAAGILNRLTGRDPLRLREPSAHSLWISRTHESTTADYFSLDSPNEGRGHGGFGWLAAAPLRRMAAGFAPKRDDASVASRAGRDNSIPDEVYTLW